MNNRIIIKPLKKDPYINWIPLSYNKYDKNSFVGYIKNKDELIALARIYPKNNKAELADVYVMEKYRGKKDNKNIKYSNLILKKIINACKNRNIDKIWLWTTSDNIQAINLYIKFNFVIKEMPIKLKDKIYKKYKWLTDKELVYMENF